MPGTGLQHPALAKSTDCITLPEGVQEFYVATNTTVGAGPAEFRSSFVREYLTGLATTFVAAALCANGADTGLWTYHTDRPQHKENGNYGGDAANWAPRVVEWFAERAGVHWYLSRDALNALLHMLYGNTVSPTDRRRMVLEVLKLADCPQPEFVYGELAKHCGVQLAKIVGGAKHARLARIAVLAAGIPRAAGEKPIVVVPPEDDEGVARQAPPPKAQQKKDVAKWKCGGCGFANFSHRTECLKCSARKGSETRPAGGAWGQVKRRRGKAPPTPAPEQPAALRKEDWDVPIVACADVKVGGSGVALAHTGEVAAQLCAHVGRRGGKLAVVSPCELAAPHDALQHETLTFPVVRGERMQITRRHVYQLGTEAVKCTFAPRRAQQRANTEELVVEIDEVHAAKCLFTQAAKGPRATTEVFQKWLQETCGEGSVHEILRPRRTCELAGRRVLQAVVRVRQEKGEAALKASGREGIFTRQCFREGRDAQRPHRVVWLRAGSSLQDALDRAGRLDAQAVCGLARSGGGLGRRVAAASHEAVMRAVLQPAEVEMRISTKYEVYGVSPALDKEGVKGLLKEELKWDVAPVRSFRRAGGSCWIVAAHAEPAERHLWVGDRLLQAQVAPDRPQGAWARGPPSAGGSTAPAIAADPRPAVAPPAAAGMAAALAVVAAA
eukprot:gene18142-23796_t